MAVCDSILQIPDDTGYWLVRADGGTYYEDFFLNNFIAVSDNEITIDLIKENSNESLAGCTIEHIKNLYIETFSDWSSQQVAHAASRTSKFIFDMKKGDLILVPSRNSKSFLLGIVTSDVYQISEDDIKSQIGVNYAVNPYLKRRDMKWLKEISRSEISDKLYWLLSAHQTIFNLQENKEQINQLLAPIYIQDGLCHGTIKISKEKGLTLNEWYDLYSVIREMSQNTQDEIIIKTNVQSPGLIEFVTDNAVTIIAVMTMLSGILWGKINVGGISVQGILPYFLTHKKERIEIEKAKKELEIMNEDKKAKQLENERSQFELEKEREMWEIQKLESRVKPLRNQLKISSFDAGRVFEDRKQMDSGDNLDADES